LGIALVKSLTKVSPAMKVFAKAWHTQLVRQHRPKRFCPAKRSVPFSL